MCCLLCLCVQGHVHGPLFEAFVAVHGDKQSFKLLGDIINGKVQADEAWEIITDREAMNFYGFAMQRVANMGTLGNKQLFFMSIFAESRGLSKSGRQAFSALGVCMPERTFYRRKQEWHTASAERRRCEDDSDDVCAW